MTSNLPDIPDWLQLNVDLLADDWYESKKMPDNLFEAATLFRRAKEGCADSAQRLALKFETGDIPGGVDIDKAMKWHAFAADQGSFSSALRLAKLLAWNDRTEDRAQAVVMAERALEILVVSRYLHKDDSLQAAAAALFLLEKNPSPEARTLIQQLLAHNRFQGHPDFDRIALGMRRLGCRDGQDLLSLQVVQTKIVEDGDFKAGIYKALETPLPLVPVATDPDAIRAILDREFPWFHKVNAEVCRQMSIAQFSTKPAFRIRPLLLAGLPGVGKTTWARRLAELCKVPFRTVMAAGGSDAMYLRGTARGWSTARPGALLQTIATEGIANPLFLVDELEKASDDSRNGRIWDVLLQMLEPASSKAYLDECLQQPCDLSWVSWIATVNTVGGLPKPLLDRFTVLLVEAPSESHFMSVVEGAVRGFAKELGLDQRMMPVLDVVDLDVLRRCRNPREINRTVRMMLENGLVKSRQGRRH